MTCEEFRDRVKNGPCILDITSAERASLLKHWLRCKPCEDWNLAGSEEEAKGLSESEKDMCEIAAELYKRKDAEDPEFRETAGVEGLGPGHGRWP